MKVFLSFALFFLVSAPFCRADGGIVLTRQSSDGMDVTVFASPAPLRAGPVDFSVLLQQAGQQTPIFDAKIVLACLSGTGSPTAWVPPCCLMDGADHVSATLANSKNKMLYSALVPVKSAGLSKLVLQITRAGKVSTLTCALEAGPPAAPLLTYWPFLAFPPLFILGFALHQHLSDPRRRSLAA